MALLSLPDEMFLDIVENLDDPKQITSALPVNKRLHYLLRDCPLRHNIRFQGSSALIWAARNGRPDLVRNILRLRLDVNTKAVSRFAETALQIAAEKGVLTMVKLLLDAGADPNLIDLQGEAALFTAIVSGHEEIADMIFRKAYLFMAARVPSMAERTQ